MVVVVVCQGRAKMWSHQMMPQMFNAIYSSDAFFLNMAVVLLRLSAPVISPSSSHILHIQPTYCLATVASREDARARKVHMIGQFCVFILLTQGSYGFCKVLKSPEKCRSTEIGCWS